MACPHCLSASVSKRKHRTSLGYRTFYCRDCDRRFNERSGTPFNDLQFPNDIVLLAVLWRLRYKLGFRDVAELLLQRGFEISYEMIRTWEFRFASLVSKNLRAKRRGVAGQSWYLDETYIKVSGRWRYLYRAIDREGNYYPMLGFKQFESASRFCTAFDELRNYLRVQATGREHVPAGTRRKIFTSKWSTLMTELSA
jgi:putative transposase